MGGGGLEGVRGAVEAAAHAVASDPADEWMPEQIGAYRVTDPGGIKRQ